MYRCPVYKAYRGQHQISIEEKINTTFCKTCVQGISQVFCRQHMCWLGQVRLGQVRFGLVTLKQIKVLLNKKLILNVLIIICNSSNSTSQGANKVRTNKKSRQQPGRSASHATGQKERGMTLDFPRFACPGSAPDSIQQLLRPAVVARTSHSKIQQLISSPASRIPQFRVSKLNAPGKDLLGSWLLRIIGNQRIPSNLQVHAAFGMGIDSTYSWMSSWQNTELQISNSCFALEL